MQVIAAAAAGSRVLAEPAGGGRGGAGASRPGALATGLRVAAAAAATPDVGPVERDRHERARSTRFAGA
jgi:hypothetical protein